MIADIVAFSGNDTVYGSPETSAGYDESLRGANGADAIFGQDGDDFINGGGGNDTLFGGGGNDTVIGRGGTADYSYGNEGNDTLCERDLGSVMVGSDSATSFDINRLFYQVGLSGTPNTSTSANGGYSTCGHPDYGDDWGDCDLYLLSTTPGSCEGEL